MYERTDDRIQDSGNRQGYCDKSKVDCECPLYAWECLSAFKCMTQKNKQEVEYWVLFPNILLPAYFCLFFYFSLFSRHIRLQISPEPVQRHENKCTADDPRHRFTDADGEISFYRNDPEREDHLADQLKCTAKQRSQCMPHSLQGISHDDKHSHWRHHRNADLQIPGRIFDHFPAIASGNHPDRL